MLVCHDLFFSKGGIAASASHPLRQAVEKHKARLQAELTKARLRRKCATIAALKEVAAAKTSRSGGVAQTVRWVRINTAKTSMEQQLRATFAGYTTVTDLVEVAQASPTAKVLKVDNNIPDLLALPPDIELIRTKNYINGEIILQDKASCFPAYLLLGDSPVEMGDILDACAAPGNKTTHLASLAETARVIYACERDAARSAILKSMVERAGTKNVHILAKQDFLALNPNDARFADITHILLDPSCSGSGILGREDVPNLTLPSGPKASNGDCSATSSKKRKRQASPEPSQTQEVLEYTALPDGQERDDRLQKLANLQTQIVKHAFKFPSACKISYSTCSVHVQENEHVVARVLQDENWRLLRRDEQVEGMRKWPHRGSKDISLTPKEDIAGLSPADFEACIRCNPKDEMCTMGFFVVCFVRRGLPSDDQDQHEEEEWHGLNDSV